MASINIKGLDRALVVAGIYNASRPFDLPWLEYPPMTTEFVNQLMKAHRVNETDFFDFNTRFLVRVKIDDTGISSTFYDAIMGQGAMEAIIGDLRQYEDPNSALIRTINEVGYYDFVAFFNHDMDEAYGT